MQPMVVEKLYKGKKVIPNACKVRAQTTCLLRKFQKKNSKHRDKLGKVGIQENSGNSKKTGRSVRKEGKVQGSELQKGKNK